MAGVVLVAGAWSLGDWPVGPWKVPGQPDDLAAAVATVRERYPRIEQLSTEGLAAWLADEGRVAPILVDVRTAAEYGVSHLPAARRAEPGAALPAWLLELPRETPIVAYCAVGFRSSAFAERLVAAGFQDARNLEGSIFAWANEGRPLVRTGDGLATGEVHPYDATWGRLLDPGHHAAVPAID